MNHEVRFDSIESAQEFLSLFAEVVLETKRNVQVYVQREATSKVLRRLEALQIITLLLEKLEIDVKKSRRILNDLRSLRRLVLQEPASSTMAARPKSVKTARATSSPSRLAAQRVSRSGVSESAVVRDVSTYRDAQTLWHVLPESSMHQWAVPLSCDPYG